MELKICVDALIRILNYEITLLGFTFPLMALVFFFIACGICCAVIGGMLR